MEEKLDEKNCIINRKKNLFLLNYYYKMLIGQFT